ncbi:MAG: TatD family hydrolase [Mycoplasma sp.]
MNQKLKSLLDHYDYYDTHCHLNLKPLLNEVDSLVEQMKSSSVMANTIGVDVPSAKIAINQAKQYENVLAIVGIHPDYAADKSPEEHYQLLDELISNNKDVILAVGEIGLDYTYDVPKDKQIATFIKLIGLAKKHSLPIMLHVREAHEDCLKILKEHAQGLNIIIHCFTGDRYIAKQYIDLGCYLSINGIITFKNKNEHLIDALVNEIGYKHLLLETDAPWLTPVPFRGRTNNPTMVKHVFNKVCELLNVEHGFLKEQLKINAIKCLTKQ